ncbi:hypothetical protein EDB83DRAFT_1993918 [Lactarius deliciosus]|nr:hypothetical protein EDB83DRAFT_1993918 [Lactarius deliciosus]
MTTTGLLIADTPPVRLLDDGRCCSRSYPFRSLTRLNPQPPLLHASAHDQEYPFALSEFEDDHLWRGPSLTSRLPSYPPSERTTPTHWKAFFARRTRGVPRLLSRAATRLPFLTTSPSPSSSTFPITPTPSLAFETLCRHNVSKPYRGSRRGSSQCIT